MITNDTSSRANALEHFSNIIGTGALQMVNSIFRLEREDIVRWLDWPVVKWQIFYLCRLFGPLEDKRYLIGIINAKTF